MSGAEKYLRSPLQWAGGKGKVLKHLLPILMSHPEPSTFIEPFVGAANVSLNYPCSNYIWNDLNGDLCNTYERILGDTEVFEDYVNSCKALFERGFDPYLNLRDEFNSLPVNSAKRAALFQYLNKHGFNGLCRYNKSGGFNVPKGTVSKSPKEVPEEAISSLRCRHKDNTIVTNKTFQEVFSDSESKKDCLIYCDPPYVPMGGSDINYTGSGFPYELQVELKELAKKSKHTTLISNHYNEVTKELYSDAKDVAVFDVQRTISCKGSERIKVRECVVTY